MENQSPSGYHETFHDNEAQAKLNSEKWNSPNSFAQITPDLSNLVSEVGKTIASNTENTENVVVEESDSYLSPGVMNPEEFLDGYEHLSNNEDVDSDPKYSLAPTSKYLSSLNEYYEKYTKLYKQIEDVNSTVVYTEKLRQKVCERTDSLDLTSRKLVTIQNELQSINDGISDDLKYFVDSKIITSKILSQNFMVCSNEYYDALNKIEKGIDYMKSKENFLEAGTYLTQYEFALTVILTKTKIYVVNALEQVTDEIYKHYTTTSVGANDNPLSIDLANQSDELDHAISFYYGKFQALSYKIKKLIEVLEDKADKFKECEKLLDEIQQVYMDKRHDLMNNSVKTTIKNTTEKYKKDRSLLFRTSCSLFQQVCHDEYKLYKVFFSKKTNRLTTFLMNLCIHLYDTLRPFIIQIEHIEILCELCILLRQDVLVNVNSEPEALETFGIVVMNLLRDIQERLVYRANVYFRDDILHYNPSCGDLDYPAVLYTMKELMSPVCDTVSKKDSESELSYSTTMAGADLQGMWYPTVKRTLRCLTRLHQCVDTQTFQGLVLEAVRACVQSLLSAGEIIKQRSSSIDGDLFKIQHLLILREQITSYNVDLTVRETALDFSKVKEAATGLIQMDFKNALLRLLLEGTPQVKEVIVDSKKQIDVHLKSSCESLINFITKELIEPLQELISKLQKFKDQPKHTLKLPTNAWSRPDNIEVVINEVKRTIKTKIQPIQQKISLYINNRETEAILFRPIKNNIIAAFVQLEQLLAELLYEKNDLLMIGCPTAEQVSLMLSSATLLNAQIADVDKSDDDVVIVEE